MTQGYSSPKDFDTTHHICMEINIGHSNVQILIYFMSPLCDNS